MNFRYKIARFLSGRYGIDELFYIIFAVAAVFAFLNCFIHSLILQLIVYLLGLVAFLRVFSRNTYARRKENVWARNVVQRAKKYFSNAKLRFNDKTHIYRKCPSCKAVLRLPRTKGKHTVVCPKCKSSFKTRVF